MKKFLRDNGILVVIAAALLAAVLAVGASILGFNPLSSIVGAIGTPFRAASAAVTQWAEDLYNRSFLYDQQAAELEELRRQVAELQEAARRGEDASRENERLRDLLKFSNKRPELALLDAAVTQRSANSWGSDLTVNKGTAHGVALKDCVVDQYGNLVGVVTEVGLNWALVTTILDPDLQLGGRISRTDDSAILAGNFTLMQEGKLSLTYLPSDCGAQEGDRVSTSGLGEQYPADLAVGTIRSLHTEANGISRYAVVEPAADIRGLRYAYIITEF